MLSTCNSLIPWSLKIADFCYPHAKAWPHVRQIGDNRCRDYIFDYREKAAKTGANIFSPRMWNKSDRENQRKVKKLSRRVSNVERGCALEFYAARTYTVYVCFHRKNYVIGEDFALMAFDDIWNPYPLVAVGAVFHETVESCRRPSQSIFAHQTFSKNNTREH